MSWVASGPGAASPPVHPMPVPMYAWPAAATAAVPAPQCVILVGEWLLPLAESSRASNPSLQQAGGVAWERAFSVAQEHH